jgi:uncharacterized protein (DUF427 family)
LPERSAVLWRDRRCGAKQARAWSYEAPRTGMQQVDHWIAFWQDVEIK